MSRDIMPVEVKLCFYKVKLYAHGKGGWRKTAYLVSQSSNPKVVLEQYAETIWQAKVIKEVANKQVEGKFYCKAVVSQHSGIQSLTLIVEQIYVHAVNCF